MTGCGRRPSANEWLQIVCWSAGWRGWQISPDRNECAPDLYEAEQRGAREPCRPVGALRQCAARARGDESASGGSFQIVEGRVTNVGRSDGRVFIDFGSDGQRSLFRRDRAGRPPRLPRLRSGRACRRSTSASAASCRTIGGRPQIALSNPSQIEVLATERKRPGFAAPGFLQPIEDRVFFTRPS